MKHIYWLTLWVGMIFPANSMLPYDQDDPILEGINARLMTVGRATFSQIKSDHDRYAIARAWMKGEGLLTKACRLALAMEALEGIGIGDADLYAKALHNRGDLWVKSGDECIEMDPDRGRHYQQAYYHYSLAGLKASKGNMAKLVKDGRVRHLYDNTKASGYDQRSQPIRDQMFKKNMLYYEKKYPPKLLPFFRQTNAYKEYEQNTRAKYYAPDFHEKMMAEVEALFPFEPVDVTKSMLITLTEVWRDIAQMLPSTPHCHPGVKPTLFFMGRSPTWFAQLNANLPPHLTYPAIHAAATGLTIEIIDDKAEAGYKAYLESLGMTDVIARDDAPIVIIDIGDTGRSLARMSTLLQKLFDLPEHRVHSVALMIRKDDAPIGFPTINLPRTRTLELPLCLTPWIIMKTAEHSHNCPVPALRPEVWHNWQKTLAAFRPHAHALKIKARVAKWAKSQECAHIISPQEDLAEADAEAGDTPAALKSPKQVKRRQAPRSKVSSDPWLEMIKNQLIGLGQLALGAVESDESRFEMARGWMKAKDPLTQSARLQLAMQALENIGIGDADLYAKTLHNCGMIYFHWGDNCAVLDPKRSGYYEQAYHHFSMAGLAASQNNMITLVKDKKVSCIMEGPKHAVEVSQS